MDASYFNSLLHKHNNYEKPIASKEDLLRDNEINFVEGPSASVDGPFKYMDKQRIDEIHLEIDERMSELSDSGLSRNEILFETPNIGVPLKDDPFFQLVKSSRTVREMLINPNEEFSADRVIEKALRQDLGVDKSQSMPKMNYKLGEYENATAPTWEYKKKYRDKDPLYDPEAQYAGHNVIGRSQRMFAYETEKPATFINRPLTRGQIRKRYMRSVSKKDLDWKNTPLITKFINDTGKLFNRYQSRLPTPVHHKVA